jgi:hypothetical protein
MQQPETPHMKSHGSAALPHEGQAVDFPDRLLPTPPAAGVIGVSSSWLEHDRLKKEPTIPFVRIGRRMVRYRLSDLLTFVGSLKMAS